MRKRKGASLMNVMVFMMFVVMLISQIFFFAKSSVDSLAEERDLLMYRMQLESLVDDAKEALKKTTGSGVITHDTKLDNDALNFYNFYEGTNVNWNKPSSWTSEYDVSIHDLDYSFDAGGFERDDWIKGGYGTFNAHKKVFASMLPLGEVKIESGDVVHDGAGKPKYDTIRNRFFLIRARVKLPENYYGRTLMYQVLVSRDEPNHNRVDVLSFQEVWL